MILYFQGLENILHNFKCYHRHYSWYMILLVIIIQRFDYKSILEMVPFCHISNDCKSRLIRFTQNRIIDEYSKIKIFGISQIDVDLYISN